MMSDPRPWLCACGHHRLHHWWHTGQDRDGTKPETEFGRCVDAGPCDCAAFHPVAYIPPLPTL